MSSVTGAFRDAAAREPDAPVLIDSVSGAAITRSCTFARAAAWAEEIAKRYRPGALVPLLTARNADTLAMIVACMMVERSFTVLNPRFRPVQLAEVLRQASVSTLCIDAMGAACLYRDRRQVSMLGDITVLTVAPETWPESAVKQAGHLAGLIGTVDLLRGKAAEPAPKKRDPGHPAACLFTSGSTGTSKGVLVAEEDLCDRAEAEIAAFGLQQGDRILNLLPWSFDVGLNQVLTALVGGTVLVSLESWLPADIAEAAQQHAVAGISAVPSIWRGVLSAEVAIRGDTLRYATISGGSLRPDEYDALAAAMPGVSILKTYGQTETFRSTIATSNDVAHAPGTVGRPFPGARVYIVDANLARLKDGEEGEILHTGLGTMLGYLNGGSAGKLISNPFRGVDGDEAPYAVLTGDLGHLDTGGRLHLHGRADDMVKVAGNRVYLQEVMALAARLDEVDASQALAVSEAGNETVIELAVVLVPHAEGMVDATSIRQKLAKIMPSYMCPRRVTLVSEIPLTPSGKVDAPALRCVLNSMPHNDQAETSK